MPTPKYRLTKTTAGATRKILVATGVIEEIQVRENGSLAVYALGENGVRGFLEVPPGTVDLPNGVTPWIHPATEPASGPVLAEQRIVDGKGVIVSRVVVDVDAMIAQVNGSPANADLTLTMKVEGVVKGSVVLAAGEQTISFDPPLHLEPFTQITFEVSTDWVGSTPGVDTSPGTTGITITLE